MTVIDMCISYDMDELAYLKACTSGHKMGKHRILADIPSVGNKHVVASLIEDGIKLIAGYIESHRICAGIQIHLIKVLMNIDVGHDPSR